MLRRRSRTIPDDDREERPAIEADDRRLELDLDLTAITPAATRPTWAQPVPAAPRATASHDEPAAVEERWEQLDELEEEDDAEPDDLGQDNARAEPRVAPRHARPAATAARRAAPLRAGPPRPAPPSPQDGISSDIQAIVSDTVTRVLSSAFVELEIEPGTLQELRDQGALHQLTAAVARIEQQTALVDGLARQVASLTAAVDELTDSTRALLRHQWDNMPPTNFWVRVQRADDEVRRALEELAAEVRGRAPRSTARG